MWSTLLFLLFQLIKYLKNSWALWRGLCGPVIEFLSPSKLLALCPILTSFIQALNQFLSIRWMDRIDFQEIPDGRPLLPSSFVSIIYLVLSNLLCLSLFPLHPSLFPSHPLSLSSSLSLNLSLCLNLSLSVSLSLTSSVFLSSAHWSPDKQLLRVHTYVSLWLCVRAWGRLCASIHVRSLSI